MVGVVPTVFGAPYLRSSTATKVDLHCYNFLGSSSVEERHVSEKCLGSRTVPSVAWLKPERHLNRIGDYY